MIVQIASETDSVRVVEIRNYSGWERGYGRLRNVVGITTRRSTICRLGYVVGVGGSKDMEDGVLYSCTSLMNSQLMS